MTFTLHDQFKRRFAYIRLSLTDACNFKCSYCLPNGYRPGANAQEPLTIPEIECLLEAFAVLGVTKLRLTGGEPTLRTDFCDIVRLARKFPNLQTIAMTTNGFRLDRRIDGFVAAGIDHLNVSLDTLDPEKFHQITGRNAASGLLAGIERALQLPQLKAVKLNTVLMRDTGAEMPAFLEYIRTRNISLRLIELMPTRDNQPFFKAQHVRAETLRQEVVAAGWTEVARSSTSGPARVFAHSAYCGTIGFIEPYSKDFCTTCNRLRITAQGELRLCLFGNKNHALRPLLSSVAKKDELVETILNLLGFKEASHDLQRGNYGSTHNFAAIGG